MGNLEEYKMLLKALEEKITTNKISELTELERECIELTKSLVGLKRYLRKQKNQDLTDIKDLIKKAKKINASVVAKIIKSYGKETGTNDLQPKKQKDQMESPEIEEAIRIVQSDYEVKEKIQLLKKYSAAFMSRIEKLKSQNKELKQEEKESFDKKVYSQCHILENEIKNNLLEIRYYQNIVGRYNTLIAQLKTRTIKVKYPKNKKIKEPEEKENRYYYFIIDELLSDDKNYLVIKEILKENKKFVNARYRGEHIIFEILDKYIYNLKRQLVNQRLVYQNPKYFYNLLNLYLHEDLDLSVEEQAMLNKRLEEIKDYVQNKKYAEAPYIINQIDSLTAHANHTAEEQMVDITLYQTYLKQIMAMAMEQKNRVYLTEDYLSSIYNKITEYMENSDHPEEIERNDDAIAAYLNLPVHDIRNCRYIGSTIALENKKYAFSIGYDNEYNIYFRVHVLDTTFIEEDSIWYQEMESAMINRSKQKNKILKFHMGNCYPAMTYQLKILKNGMVGSFKTYMSTIEINKMVRNVDLIDYRSDDELKSFIGCMKYIANFYHVDLETLSTDDIEKLVDYTLNVELKQYFSKNNLPSLYFVELGLSDEEKDKVHNSICYYLGQISKKEAHKVYKLVKTTPASRLYSKALLEEGKMELDSTTFIGYNNLLVLRAFLNNKLTETILTKYQERFQECAQKINGDDLFVDYFTGKQLDKKIGH